MLLLARPAYDSFGNVRDDSWPLLFMPVGFAGGLVDRDTGLIRFGWRDYDPLVGRFTAPDPLGDTGGDHDLYDYCVDDPVTMNDPSGLLPPLLILGAVLGAKALGLGIAAGGAYGSAKVADSIKSAQDGEESTAARDAVKAVAPDVAIASGVSLLPGLAKIAPGAAIPAGRAIASVVGEGAAAASGIYTSLGQRIAVALEASTHGKKIMAAVRAGEGFLNPNLPEASSMSGMLGAATAQVIREAEKKNKEKKENK